MRAALGAPDSIIAPEGRNEDGALVTRWIYPTIEFQFDETGHRYLATWSVTGFRTARGIGVGSTGARIVGVYGRPSNKDVSAGVTYYLYGRYATDEDTRGIIFTLRNGVVTNIQVGEVMSIE